MASEIERAELERICAELTARIDARNSELAALESAHRARMDAITGEARIEKQVIEKEIHDLEFKRDHLSSILNNAEAEVQAGRIRNVQEAERLRRAEQNLQRDTEELIAKIHDLSRRETDLAAKFKTLAEERNSLNALREEAKAYQANANTDRSSADLAIQECRRQKEETQKFINEAKANAQDIMTLASAKMVEAIEAAKKIEAQERSVAELSAEARSASMKAQALIDEYNKKLEESRAWADENSNVSAKLSVWEAALRATDRRLQDDKAKLAVAEKEFAANQKREVRA